MDVEAAGYSISRKGTSSQMEAHFNSRCCSTIQ